jgi:hypothetical protein
MARLSTLTSDLVGRRYPEFKFHITPLWIRDYKKALGYSEEQVQDDAFLPHTFVSCLRDAEFATFESLDLKLAQLLHAAQEYVFHKQPVMGDWITSRCEITRLLQKRGKAGGSMVFLELRNTFRRQSDGADLVSTLCTVVVREESEA